MKYLILSILVSLNVYCASDKVIDEVANRLVSVSYFFNKIQSGEVPIEVITQVISKANDPFELEQILQALCHISPRINSLIESNAKIILSEYFLAKYPERYKNGELDMMLQELFNTFAKYIDLMFCNFIEYKIDPLFNAALRANGITGVGRPIRKHYEHDNQKYKYYIILPKLLLLSGVDINATEDDLGHEYTVLMRAIKENHINLVNLLVRFGANLDYKENVDGQTALMLSANLEIDCMITKALINAGANIHTVDKYGRNALKRALWHDYDYRSTETGFEDHSIKKSSKNFFEDGNRELSYSNNEEKIAALAYAGSAIIFTGIANIKSDSSIIYHKLLGILSRLNCCKKQKVKID